MPVFIDTQNREYQHFCKKEIINRNLLDCYNRLLEKQDPASVIRSHRACINNMNIQGKNKYNTVRFLEQYKNTDDKTLALSVLTNTLSNRCIFSKYS